MKKMMLVLCAWCLVLGASGALKDDIPDDYELKVDLTSATQPGTPLKNNTIYTVRGHVLFGNIEATLLGTDDLKNDFEPCGDLELIGGAFECDIPEGKSFFKASLPESSEGVW